MKYDVVVFDVDGTLINTEETILFSLQHMLLRMTGHLYPFEKLYFALGITGAEALRWLELPEPDKAMEMWLAYMGRYEYLQKPFDGIDEIVQWLNAAGVRLGIVTSRTKPEFQKSTAQYNFIKYFDTVVNADDTVKHKPEPEPMLCLLEKMAAEPSKVLYIGDSVYDMECARKAGVDGALALWGAHFPEQIHAVHKIANIMDIKSLFI